MKKLFVIPFLFFMSFGLVSCLDETEPIYRFWDEPALVEEADDANLLIKTPHGRFIVQELAENAPVEGDLLWTRFYVDMDKQSDSDRLVVSGFSYSKINKDEVFLPEKVETFEEFLNNDYSEPFRFAEMYNMYIDRYLFFGFYHEVSGSKEYIYEIVCNPEIEASNGYPTLYIRAKNKSEENGNRVADKNEKNIIAFDMSDFLDKYGKEIKSGEAKSVKFNLKYKIGINSEGKDIYREFISNPLSWSAK